MVAEKTRKLIKMGLIDKIDINWHSRHGEELAPFIMSIFFK
jgi:hypothetical protein